MGQVHGMNGHRPARTLGPEQARTRFFAEKGWRFGREGGKFVAVKGAVKCGPRPCMRSLLNHVAAREASGR